LAWSKSTPPTSDRWLALPKHMSGVSTNLTGTRDCVTDRDAIPLTEDDLKRMKRIPQAKIIRRPLDLTQEEFALRYHIPLGTLRDWEQGREQPDQPTRAYLTLIDGDPEHVYRIIKRHPN
jgi:putative transcriptional regulator